MEENREIPPPSDPNDLYVLAGMYFQGITVPVDKEKAVALYTMSADKGNVDAMERLGIIYMTGDGAERDRSRSFELFRKAQGLGNNDCRYFLALHYARGWGTDADPREAVRLCRMSAENGCPAAMLEMGIWTFEGALGLEPSVDLALKWMMMAVDRDYPDALYEVGCIYAFGEKVPKDETYGRTLLRTAAALGDPDAQEALEASENGASERP